MPAIAKAPRYAIATQLRIVREGPRPAAVKPIRSPSDAAAVVATFYAAEGGDVETFLVLMLDAQHKCIGNAPLVITRGLVNSSLVHPREVFRAAIVANACAIIVAHNHPSGDTTPSAEDKVVTAQLVAAGRLLDIPVHDHIIVGDGRYMSFAEGGLL